VQRPDWLDLRKSYFSLQPWSISNLAVPFDLLLFVAVRSPEVLYDFECSLVQFLGGAL
jgi:hypothetical protein